MLRITNISITDAAGEVLRRERARFRPRRDGEVFGLLYMSSFVNPDGTTVAGFVPGYMVASVAPNGSSDAWARVQLLDGPDFVFMPKFRWSIDEDYLIDLASPAFGLFSIGPVG